MGEGPAVFEAMFSSREAKVWMKNDQVSCIGLPVACILNVLNNEWPLSAL